MDILKGLSLFSGIGGIDFALREFIFPVAYCEIEPYCQSVLLQRMQEGNLPPAPIWDDVRTLPHHELPPIDIIYGGFPCTDISVAGHGKGLEGERSGLFFEIVRLAKEIKPQFIFLENVPAITCRGGLRVVREITEMGYDCRWCTISAASIGALHKRERWFLLGYAKHHGCHGTTIGRSSQETVPNYSQGENKTSESTGTSSPSMLATESIPYANSESRSRLSSRTQKRFPITRICGKYATVDEWQEALSQICRVTDGVSHRMDRIKALGNAVVPLQVKTAFEILMGVREMKIEVNLLQRDKR